MFPAIFILSTVRLGSNNNWGLGKLFYSKNLDKIKNWAWAGIHHDIFNTGRRSNGAFWSIYGVKQLTQSLIIS